MAEFMRRADIAFTSAGRTVFELALVGVPSVILAQNDRELTHLFASEQNGFVNLGLGEACPPDRIRGALAGLIDEPEGRLRMHDLMRATDLRSGRDRVVTLVEDAIMRR
jgi:spore coat polysaccharide biosynthesis predicted glycosyltransferase SpsG